MSDEEYQDFDDILQQLGNNYFDEPLEPVPQAVPELIEEDPNAENLIQQFDDKNLDEHVPQPVPQEVPEPIEENTNEEKSPICLLPIDNLAICQPCRHRFCRFCIVEWADVLESESCPLCRANINVILTEFHGQPIEIIQIFQELPEIEGWIEPELEPDHFEPELKPEINIQDNEPQQVIDVQFSPEFIEQLSDRLYNPGLNVAELNIDDNRPFLPVAEALDIMLRENPGYANIRTKCFRSAPPSLSLWGTVVYIQVSHIPTESVVCFGRIRCQGF